MTFDRYFNGKLLITGEYLVLNGAQALAVPVKFGQRLQVDDSCRQKIEWKSIDHQGTQWFSGSYSLDSFEILETSNPTIAVYPQRLLRAAQNLNSGFLANSEGCSVIATLNYPQPWGLGSSSTLIAAIARWAKVDPFSLHFAVSKGSGYDIACAESKGPILYSVHNHTPAFEEIGFHPDFSANIFFVYLGKKKDTSEGINAYKMKIPETNSKWISEASRLTREIIHSTKLDSFEKTIRDHEMLISSLLGQPLVKNSIFHDLPGEVKSLGAWGGDFCMLTWHDVPEVLPKYLSGKGFDTWFSFNEIVLLHS